MSTEMWITAAPDNSIPDEDRTVMRRFEVWRRFRRHKLAMVSLIVFTLVVLAAITAPILPLQPFDQVDLTVIKAAPSLDHWMGTDEIGRDVFSRMIWSSQTSLTVASCIVILELVFGILAGALAGYFGGWLDNLLMRLVDLMLAVPFYMAVIIVAAIIGPGTMTTITVLAALSWMTVARLTRGEFLRMARMEFVEAARALGVGDRRIIFRHILPNAVAPLIVQATLDFAGMIIVESTLSFLGYGVQEPFSSWGKMLSTAQESIWDAPWLAIFPGVAIVITVLCINFIGDGLRDALDPRMKNS